MEEALISHNWLTGDTTETQVWSLIWVSGYRNQAEDCLRDFSSFLLATSATTASQVSYCHGGTTEVRQFHCLLRRLTWVLFLEEDRRLPTADTLSLFVLAAFTRSNIQVTLVDSLGFSWLVLWNCQGIWAARGRSQSQQQNHPCRRSVSTHDEAPQALIFPALTHFIHLSLSRLCVSLLSPFSHYSASLFLAPDFVSWHNIAINFSSSKHRKKRRRCESEEGDWG